MTKRKKPMSVQERIADVALSKIMPTIMAIDLLAAKHPELKETLGNLSNNLEEANEILVSAKALLDGVE